MTDPHNTAYYFGCGGGAGHYLWIPGEQPRRAMNAPRWMNCIDGTFPPADGSEEQFKATMLHIHGYTVLSWWDRSVDKRPGSNSTVLLPFIMTNFPMAVVRAKALFPWVFARMKQDLKQHST